MCVYVRFWPKSETVSHPCQPGLSLPIPKHRVHSSLKPLAAHRRMEAHGIPSPQAALVFRAGKAVVCRSGGAEEMFNDFPQS